MVTGFCYNNVCIKYDCERIVSFMRIPKSKDMYSGFPHDELVSTPNGLVRVDSLKVGDEVYDSSKNVCHITALQESRLEVQYDIEFDNGMRARATTCQFMFYRHQTSKDKSWKVDKVVRLWLGYKDVDKVIVPLTNGEEAKLLHIRRLDSDDGRDNRETSTRIITDSENESILIGKNEMIFHC